MVARKAIHIAVVALFSLGLFSSGAVANVDCGKACCMAGVKGDHAQVTGTHTTAMPQGCCSKTQDTPCNLKKGISDHLFDANILDIRGKDDPSFMVMIAANDFSGDHFFNHIFQQTFTEASARSAPIYLQTLSLLC